LQPRQRPRQGSANDLLSFHGPLHGGLGIEHERPPCCSWLYPSAPAKRTFHLLSGADRSCAPYSLPMSPLLPRQTSTILDATLKPSAPELVPEKGGPHVQPEVLSVPADTCRGDRRPLHGRARR